jgi:hypothetical protein
LASSTELLSSFSVSSFSCLMVLDSRSLDKGWMTAEDEYPDEDSSALLPAEHRKQSTLNICKWKTVQFGHNEPGPAATFYVVSSTV